MVAAGSGGAGGLSSAPFAISRQFGSYGGGGSPVYTPSGGSSGRGGSGAVPSAGARSPGAVDAVVQYPIMVLLAQQVLVS